MKWRDDTEDDDDVIVRTPDEPFDPERDLGIIPRPPQG